MKSPGPNRMQSLFGLRSFVIMVACAIAWPAGAQSPESVPAEVFSGVPNENNAGDGGGSMADFDSLMTLIQQTVEPDTWEALGGVGTMAPYPAGVLVDADGLLREATSQEIAGSDALDSKHADAIARMLSPEAASPKLDSSEDLDWRSPAPIRCVSIRRMMQAYAAATMAGRPLDQDDALVAMAGLSKVAVVVVTPDDFILAGTVGGFENVGGWTVDAKNGLPTMRLSGLAVGLTAARSGNAYGCTIDPSTAGLQAAASLGQRIVSGEVPMVTAADALASALGRQDIRVFGTSADHEVAYLMVEADRHMKRLALGDEPMPVGVRNYLLSIAATGDGTPPSDLLLRLWFTSHALRMRTSDVESTQVIQLAGTPLQLSGQNELALKSGQRGNVVIDPATLAFVDHFNQNWESIRRAYPIYGALESLYSSTAIAELWTRRSPSNDHAILQRALMYFAAEQANQLIAPKQVDSIAVFHRYKRGRKRHQVLLASGGVKIQAADLLPKSSPDYPGLKSLAKIAEQRPDDRWWWNARGVGIE
ncbi:DUF1598 domain-containing protein [Neorhodopirellula lusitana]|uniref:DUF1598 domain-containing protein n=1 Tax=Neorhodopirellula lusitana TaxID=445327 RepID=UPI003850DE20